VRVYSKQKAMRRRRRRKDYSKQKRGMRWTLGMTAQRRCCTRAARPADLV
jgi:hypothetical protein